MLATVHKETTFSFQAALFDHGFHCGLSTAAIHVGGGTADSFGGPHGIGDNKQGLRCLRHQASQCEVGQIR
jgi:hypothetical protein